MTADAPGNLSPEDRELFAKLEAARVAAANRPAYAQPGYDYSNPAGLPQVNKTLEKAKAAAANLAGAQTKEAAEHSRFLAKLRRLERAGGLGRANELRLKAAELLAELSVEVVVEIERTEQGRPARSSVRSVVNPTGPVALWVERETEPDDEGTRTTELFEAFRDFEVRSGTATTRTQWGRQLTALGYPTKNVRTGDSVARWRLLRLKVAA